MEKSEWKKQREEQCNPVFKCLECGHKDKEYNWKYEIINNRLIPMCPKCGKLEQ